MTGHEEVVLCTTECRLNLIDCLKLENDRFRAALERIGVMKFCGECSEASQIAREALTCEEVVLGDGEHVVVASEPHAADDAAASDHKRTLSAA